MGLIKAFTGAAGGVFADQWKEYFYCESIPQDVLVCKGQRRTSRRSSNTKGSDNILSNGSVIAVADGQCMMIVEQGKVVELCAEPGEYTYDASTEPSIFYGSLGEGIKGVFQTVGKRFTFGGEAPKDQRIYYFNTKELPGNKYGTPAPVPFRVVDRNIGLDTDISIRCFGEYSYRIANPMLFYANVCGNVAEDYTRDAIEGQLKGEVLTALQPAFARISELGIRYSALPGHAMELADAMNEVLSKKWRELRGLEIVAFGVSSVTASREDEQMIKDLQRRAVYRNPGMAGAALVDAQTEAMKAAASNEGTGAAMAFMGMNMAQQAGGMNAQDFFRMEQQRAEQVSSDSWKCGCGAVVSGKFCPECGSKKPEPRKASGAWRCACGHLAEGKFCTECGAKRPGEEGWICSCGAVNKGKFCPECGARKPAGVPQYRCDKCGWEPAKGAKPPRFCPECGDPFDNEDIR